MPIETRPQHIGEATQREDGSIEFLFRQPIHGVWAHTGAFDVPDGMTIDATNCQIVGNSIVTQRGNKKFIATAFPSGTATLLADRRTPGTTPVIFLATTTGAVWKWNPAAGGSWDTLRTGLSTTATIWWSKQAYGTDVYVANQTDGVWRFDGTYFMPIGSKVVAGAETYDTGTWTNNTADTVNFKEGLQSEKVQSGNPGASAALTYTVASTDFTAGRYSGAAYAIAKTPGTDFYHFWVKFSAGATATITAATTTFVITDSAGKTLTFAASLWRSAKTATATAIVLNDNNWHEVWCYANDGADSGTFDPTKVLTFKWVVTTAAGQTDINIDDIYVVYASTMPNVQFLAEWRNILFGANTVANPDSLVWSPVRAPDQWTGTAIVPVKAGGEQVTALASFFHQLTIGTDHHVHTLSGNIIGQTYPAYLFDINEVTDEAGISSHRSVVKVENKLYWFYLNTIIEYSGTAVQKVSYALEPTLAALDVNALQYIVGARFRDVNELWWSYKRTAGSVNDRVLRFDFIHKALLPTLLTTPLLYVTYESGVERLLTIDGTNRFVYRQDDDTPGYAFYGTAIPYTFELPALGLYDVALNFKEIFLSYMSATGSFTPSYRLALSLRDLAGVSYTAMPTVDQGATGERGRIRLGYVGKLCQVKLTSTGVPFDFQFPFVVVARTTGDERAY